MSWTNGVVLLRRVPSQSRPTSIIVRLSEHRCSVTMQRRAQTRGYELDPYRPSLEPEPYSTSITHG
jgi:hypothetical protein